jgi:DNA-binding NtrC family response regulator
MKALLVDPDPDSRDALRRAFDSSGVSARGVATATEGEKQLAELRPDLLVVALEEGFPDGARLLENAIASDPRRAVYALVGHERLEDGVIAMARGARDFLWRPVSSARVAILLARLEERRQEESRAEDLRLALAKKETMLSLAGSSPRWKQTLAALEREACLDSPVLLAGEAGTEKQAAALALHRLSRRGAAPFAIAPEEGLESALIGGGTLFLNVIESLSRSNQERLLAALDDVRSPRLIVASDVDPAEAVATGLLAEPLFEALREHVVHLPPLRERGTDVLALARRFLFEIDPSLFFDAEAADALSTHDWPGNVRELEGVVQRAAQLADGSAIGSTVVLSVLGGAAAKRRARPRKPPVVRVPVGASLADVERRLIQKTLEFARGNKPKAAQLLKLSLKTIYNKIKEYGLEH